MKLYVCCAWQAEMLGTLAAKDCVEFVDQGES
jgi:hypothetical protein